jgi:polysaccharide biosynthesis transport protein
MSDNDMESDGPSYHLVEGGGPAVPAERRDLSPPDYPPDDEESGGLNLRVYAAAIMRHKWLILALGVVGTVAGYYAGRFLPEEFEAQATVWIESTGRGDAGPIRQGELLQSYAWIELLRSFQVLDEVVLRTRLYLTPDAPADSALFRDFGLQQRFAAGDFRLRVSEAGDQYTLLTRDGAQVERGRVGEPIGASIGFDWQPPASVLRPRLDVAFSVAVPREVAVGLNRALRTRIDRNANFLRLELRQPTAERAAGVLNAITDRYVEVAADLKRFRLDERTEILEEQLTYAEANLLDAERALQGFKVATATLPTERGGAAMVPGVGLTQDPVFGRYFSMRVEQEQLKLDREAIAAVLADEPDAVTMVTALEAIPAVSQASTLRAALGELTRMETELRTMLYRFTEEHPPVRELTRDKETLHRETIPALARTLMDQLAARERSMAQTIGSAGSDLQQIPPRLIEEASLSRQVAITESLYRTLESRVQEARLAAASAIPDIRILDEARAPRNPVGDERQRLMLLAMLGGLGLGVLGAVMRERLDPSIRYPAQIADLGMGVLGAVPELRRAGDQFTADALAEATEAFRGIRLNVMYSHGAGPILTTITSPGVGDGKSFIASNLAVSFAELGRRTLLIDGDVRRGRIHELLKRERVPGLTDLLKGTASLTQVIRNTSYERLDVLTCGRRYRNAPELIDSSAMRRLILEVRTRYDVILVDSAPLGAGIDPLVLGALTGSMVVVFRTGQTDQDLSAAKLDMLDRLPIRLLGAVMNGIKRNSAGYRYYHYYSYLPGYGTEDEVEEPKQLQKV